MRDFLFEFMGKLGNKKEFNLFHNLFKKIPASKFAVIKISGATLEKHMDMVAKDIAFLNKIGIYPIVVHGAGTKLDVQLPNSKKIDGFRVTKKNDMHIIENIFNDISSTLENKINESGGSAKKANLIFNCNQLKKYGYVGDIKEVDILEIENIISQNKTPIISPIGKCDDFLVNINADTAAKEVVKAVKPYKIIILTETGGILDEEGKIISFLNPKNLDSFKNITGGMLLKLREITELVEENSESSVVITSVESLLKEMFTIKGNGTFIKSYTINSTNRFTNIDEDKVKMLLEKAFGKTLDNEYFKSDIHEIIYEKNYEGIAIIKKLDGIPYLDKLAVAKHRQETGLGGCIWSEVTKKHTKLTWRVTPNNPFNSFYFKKCTGCLKYSDWNIYWINLTQEELKKVTSNILILPKTML